MEQATYNPTYTVTTFADLRSKNGKECLNMLVNVKEIANRWQLSQRRIAQLCVAGEIKGAKKRTFLDDSGRCPHS